MHGALDLGPKAPGANGNGPGDGFGDDPRHSVTAGIANLHRQADL